MAFTGAFPVAQGPTLPLNTGSTTNTTQTQVSGAVPIANRTISTPNDALPIGGPPTITLTPGGTFAVRPSMMDPSSYVQFFLNQGIACSIDIIGRLVFPTVNSVSGDSNTLKAMGLT